MTATAARALAIAVLLPVSAGAQQMMNLDITEYPAPGGADSRPRDPFVGPDGLVWFVGQRGNYVAYLDPATRQFRQYEVEAGTFPHNVIVDERAVWYTGNANGRIGRLDPATGKLRIFPMPDPSIRDPHTLVFHPDGTLWFTVQIAGYIGHLEPESGQIQLIRMPDGSRPYGIKLDSHGDPWVVLFGTNRIVKVDHSTREVTSFDLPRAEARPRRIAITPDDRVWYVDYAKGMLGMYDPASGKFSEWASPGGPGSRPYGMAVDDRGRVWYAEGGNPNHIVGFDPATRTFIGNTPIPSRGGAVRNMMFDVRSRMLWFGTDTGNIGCAKIPE